MSTNARATYKLPAANRHIVAFDEYNYFGGYLAKRDMTPIGFDRACPVSPYAPRHPMVMPGCGAVIERAMNNEVDDPFTYAGVHAMSGLDLSNPVFESKEGPTAGQRFVIAGAQIFQVTATGEMVPRYRVTEDPSGSNKNYGRPAHIVLAAIVAENATSFIVQYNSTEGAYGTNPSPVSAMYARRFMNVYKSGQAATPLLGHVTGQVGSPTNISAPASTTTGAEVGTAISANKFVRKLTTMADGRIVYAYCGLQYNGTYNTSSTMSLSYTQCLPKIVVVDPIQGRADSTRAIPYSSGTNRFVNGVPSPLIGRLPENVEGLGTWYYPEVVMPSDGSYAIRMFVVPALPTVVSSIGTTATDTNSAMCTIVGAPENFTMLAPADHTPNARAQISTWTVQEGGDEYLITFGHGNGRVHEENDQSAPASLSQLCVFRIGDNLSELEYSHHMNSAAGYGTVLTDFVASPDFKTVIVMNSTGFGILTWHPTLRRYTASQWRAISGGLYRLHLDTRDQIWVENMEGNVSVFNITMSASVNVEFVDAPSSIIYTGETLEQDVRIDAFTFTGTRIARQVRLSAKGCTFDDGNTVKTVQTSADESTQLTLFVNGSGNVTIDAALV